MTILSIALSLVLSQTPGPSNDDAEALINLDVKDADVLDILRLLARLGDFNLVADSDVRCRFTLSLKSVTWQQVMELTLRSCHLGEDRLGDNLVRVASVDQLTREQEERRRYEEEKSLAGPLQTTYRRLSYARARDLAPLLEKTLSPRGEIAFDDRTNTLIITDVAR
ncbi:MAG TPA: secretin N-terminal domain-containing protein [Vicinamibacteria bacterium]